MLLSVFLSKMYNGSKVMLYMGDEDNKEIIYKGLVGRVHDNVVIDELETMEISVVDDEVAILVEKVHDTSDLFNNLAYVLTPDVDIEILVDNGISIEEHYHGTLEHMPPKDKAYFDTLQVLEVGTTLDGVMSITLRGVQ